MEHITDEQLNDYRKRILAGEDLSPETLRRIIETRTHEARAAFAAQQKPASKKRSTSKPKIPPGALDSLLSQDLPPADPLKPKP